MEPSHPTSLENQELLLIFHRSHICYWGAVDRSSVAPGGRAKRVFSSLRNVLIPVVLLSFLTFHLNVSLHLSSWTPQMLSVSLWLLPFFYFRSPIWNGEMFFLSLNFHILPVIKIQVKCHEIVLDLQVLNSPCIWVNLTTLSVLLWSWLYLDDCPPYLSQEAIWAQHSDWLNL